MKLRAACCSSSLCLNVGLALPAASGSQAPPRSPCGFTSLQKADLAHVTQHARMNKVLSRGRRERVLEGGFARLLDFRAERRAAFVQGARETIRDFVRKRRAREHEWPGAH